MSMSSKKLSALDNIFVPLDGSKRAESVLPYVEKLYQKTTGQITLFHAVEPSVPVTSEAYSGLISKAVHMAKDRAEEYLTSVADRLTAKGFRVSMKVVIGDPAPQILLTASRLGQTTIALSGFSLTDRPNKSFGSVADHVLHYNRTPTLLVRPSEDAASRVSFKTIVVPMDGSLLSEKALGFAAKLARQIGCNLKLLQVLPTRQQMFTQMGFDVSERMNIASSLEQPLKNEGEQYLIKQVSRLRPYSLSIEYEVADGPIVETIIKRAHSAEKPLIVFCTAGSRGAKYRWRLGSVAKGLVRASDVPLIAVPHSYIPA